MVLIVLFFVSLFQESEKNLKSKTDQSADLEAKVIEMAKSLHDLEDKYGVLRQAQSNRITDPKKALL